MNLFREIVEGRTYAEIIAETPFVKFSYIASELEVMAGYDIIVTPTDEQWSFYNEDVLEVGEGGYIHSASDAEFSTNDKTLLKIWEYLKNSTLSYSLPDIINVDVTVLSLDRQAWEMLKGRKNSRKYLNGLGEEVLSFDYIYVDTADGQIESLSKELTYRKKDGSIAVRKPIKKKMNSSRLITLNREIRQNQIDTLRGKGAALRVTAATLPVLAQSQYLYVADNVDFLWLHYRSLLEEYVSLNSPNFKSAVVNESNASVIPILDTVVNEELETVRDIIIKEIN